MLRYLVGRVLLTIPVLLGVATLVFALIHLVPGDPAQSMLGDGAAPQDVAELRSKLGLDRPLLSQYVVFLRGAASGNLGQSFRTGQPVTTSILERMPATAELALSASRVPNFWLGAAVGNRSFCGARVAPGGPLGASSQPPSRRRLTLGKQSY